MGSDEMFSVVSYFSRLQISLSSFFQITVNPSKLTLKTVYSTFPTLIINVYEDHTHNICCVKYCFIVFDVREKGDYEVSTVCVSCAKNVNPSKIAHCSHIL